MAHESSRGQWRLEIWARVAFQGPVRVSSGERLSLLTDLPILQDSSNRTWIPGSSVRGVLRDWCTREAPFLGVAEDAVNRLFGSSAGASKANSTDDRQGRLVVRDLELGNDATSVDFRDHVKIDREWNTAAYGGKFDEEVAVPRCGTLRIVYHGDRAQDEELRLIGAAMSALEDGRLAVGGKSGSGFGWLKPATANWLTRTIEDRGSEKGLADFITRRLESGSSVTPMPPESGEFWRQAPTWTTADPARCRKAHPWNRLTIPLTLKFDGPMVIVGQNRRTAADEVWIHKVDDAFLTNFNGDAVLPGSSFRGVLKSSADRLTRSEPRLESARDALFGTPSKRGLLQVGEGLVPADQVRPLQLDHVAIDRLTGFSADGKLFQVAALQSPTFQVQLQMRWHDSEADQRAVALLFFLIRDIGSGRGWVGSRTTRGYGHLKSVKVDDISGWWMQDEINRQEIRGLDWTRAGTYPGLEICFRRWSELWR